MPRVFIRTFGCQMNEYDSARMVDVLREAEGYELTDDPAQADLLLLNTCSVREKAQEKVFSQLGGWRQLKKANPGLLIGVGGCVASQEGDGITRRAPFVDLVFGPQTLHRLPDMIRELRDRREKSGLLSAASKGSQAAFDREYGPSVIDVSFPEIEKFDAMPAPRADGATAFVSIMEGCSKYCTFCVVPYTRGEEVSRPVDSVMAEIRSLAEQGVREVNLLGQNVNAYNGPMDDGTPCDLGTLIYCVADVPGIERIRFTTSHPVEFKDSLIEAYRDVPQLANYLHLPVQAGSDRILSAMKRGYTALEYKQKIRKLRAVRPDICISSDFIVGFPGETARDFAATLNLIAEVGFDQSFSFIYSRRPGTPAASLPDDVTHEEKQQRLEILQARINQQAMAISRRMVGTVQRVLVERPAKKHAPQIAGRTENMRWVNFDGPLTLLNRFADVLITEAMPNSLRGRLIGAGDDTFAAAPAEIAAAAQ